MKESDRELLKNSGTAAIDAVVAAIDTSFGGGMPLTTGAWALAKTYFGRGLVLRQKKALEWIEMVRDNPSIITRELLESNNFQDAFVASLEGYVKERSQDKRTVLRSIFIDYSAFPNSEDYPLEKMQNLVNLITLNEMRTFSSLGSEVKAGDQISLNNPQDSSAIAAAWGLRQIGLLRENTQTIVIGGTLPAMVVSELGVEFARYLKS